jgi:hypothetical protein
MSLEQKKLAAMAETTQQFEDVQVNDEMEVRMGLYYTLPYLTSGFALVT